MIQGRTAVAMPLIAITLVAIMGIVAISAFTISSPSSLLRDHPDSIRVASTGGVDTTLLRIDLDRAIEIKIPATRDDLTPVTFHTSDGREGWAVRIPGNRPIATPCYANGRLFVGGGYGAYEFYAFDAMSGESAWTIKTADDGPTAAVEEDGYVAFNTESCTVIVVEEATGKLVWQEYLGDPLMSQPAVSNGRLFIAHPKNGRGGVMQNQSMQNTIPHLTPHNIVPDDTNDHQSPELSDNESGSHALLCADLKTGRHIWRRTISGDVITAPVVDSNRVFFTCFDGTSYALDAATGEIIWKKQNAGTSAPLIVDGQAIYTAKEKHEGKTVEGFKMAGRENGDSLHAGMFAVGAAEYLDEDKGGGVGLHAEAQAALDGSVGFASAPQSAGLANANKHIGVNTVVGAWAYQGARASYSRGRLMNAQATWLNSVRVGEGGSAWRAQATGKEITDNMQLFLPPALGGDNLYLCTTQGHLLSVRQNDGTPRFIYKINHPTTFQPTLAGGNMYVGTADGWLICLKLKEKEADGWYAWGGNGAHNKTGR
jgi:Ca-activated chloride channel family protein